MTRSFDAEPAIPLSRRRFLELAAAIGATAAWSDPLALFAAEPWRERRDLYPEGVASGDPDSTSVLLWTRRSPIGGEPAESLRVEVATDESFAHVVASAETALSVDSDWTCRVLVGGLLPATVYWYRFADTRGNGSRIGRTLTAPAPDDRRPVKFAFVSCQNVNQGAQNAFRRMIFEDRKAPAAEQLGFLLHLGDFIYELVWYPEDRPQGMYDRRLRDVVRYANGEKVNDFHVPTTVDDYRAVYRGYLHDPDLQDARAWLPFVPIWDNHEFSWKGWQSLVQYYGPTLPAQTRKVAANQAWFEYLPARVRQPRGVSFDRFDAPKVVDAPIERFDDAGLGAEPNNLAAIDSLIAYRAVRWGAHLDLLITDMHSFRSEEPSAREEAKPFSSLDFYPQEALEILDGGRDYDGGQPPATIRLGGAQVPNFRRAEPPQTILGTKQKAWFLDALRASGATWKVWGASAGTLDFRIDPQHLPAGVGKPWPGAGYAGFGGGDPSTTYLERAEIYDLVRIAGITGFATVAGDRHSFWAGLAAKSLPPAEFAPVGVAFVTGSISAPGLVEAYEHRLPKDDPLRSLYLVDRPDREAPEAAINLLLRHGVRTCLEYQKSGDLARALAARDPELAPHLDFVDMGGHGYATVRLDAETLECEFVCIPRPLERSAGDDGGPLRYRVRHRAKLWQKGERPRLEAQLVEGDVGLSV